MSRDSSLSALVPPSLPPPRHIFHGLEKGGQSGLDITSTWKESRTPAMPRPSLSGDFPLRRRADTEEERRSFTHYPSQSATSSHETSLLGKPMLPAEVKERIEGAYDFGFSPPEAPSTSDLNRRRESTSGQSPKQGIYSGHASSNHSSTSIRSNSSNNSYTCSVRSARGILDTDSDSRFSGLERRHSTVSNNASTRHVSPLGLPRKNSTHEIHNAEPADRGDYQTWEEFCVLQLVSFLQVCTLDDVHALTESPTLLRNQFKLYLKRMISQEGNIDFLSYQASPQPSQLEAQLQLFRHQKSIFSQSRSSIRSYNSRSSHSSASTASSFSSQISDGTLLNHVQQEAKSLKDCLIKIQKKLTDLRILNIEHIKKMYTGTESNKGQELPAVESAPLTTLTEANKAAIDMLHSKEADLGLLGFCKLSAPCVASKLLMTCKRICLYFSLNFIASSPLFTKTYRV